MGRCTGVEPKRADLWSNIPHKVRCVVVVTRCGVAWLPCCADPPIAAWRKRSLLAQRETMKTPRPLTPRQQQVFDAIGRGLSFPEMERELGISAGRARNIARDGAKKINNPLGLTPKA